MPGGEVVAAIEHHVALRHPLRQVVRGGAGLVGYDGHIGIDRMQGLLRGMHFGLADAGGGVGDLSLQIAELNHVVVQHGDGADAGAGEVEQGCAAQAARTNHQRMAVQNTLLAVNTPAGQHEVSGITQELLVSHGLTGCAASKAGPKLYLLVSTSALRSTKVLLACTGLPLSWFSA